jgi:hypothetical protein
MAAEKYAKNDPKKEWLAYGVKPREVDAAPVRSRKRSLK